MMIIHGESIGHYVDNTVLTTLHNHYCSKYNLVEHFKARELENHTLMTCSNWSGWY